MERRDERRKDDPWKVNVELRMEHLEEKAEKTNQLMAEILEAWDVVKGGFQAITFISKAMKTIAVLMGSIAAVWAFCKHILRIGV